MAKGMKTAAVCAAAVTVIFVVLYSRFRVSTLLTFAITFSVFAYHFVMRLAVGYAVDSVMKNRADYTKRWYRIHPFEERLYRKLNVKRWKDRLPAYQPSQFSMKEHTPAEIVQATCQAEIVHEIIAVLSLLPILASIPFGAFAVFLLTSVLSAGFDLMFVMIQRYNRPRLIGIMEKYAKKKEPRC